MGLDENVLGVAICFRTSGWAQLFLGLFIVEVNKKFILGVFCKWLICAKERILPFAL